MVVVVGAAAVVVIVVVDVSAIIGMALGGHPRTLLRRTWSRKTRKPRPTLWDHPITLYDLRSSTHPHALFVCAGLVEAGTRAARGGSAVPMDVSGPCRPSRLFELVCNCVIIILLDVGWPPRYVIS